jgi:hypothetical protein
MILISNLMLWILINEFMLLIDMMIYFIVLLLLHKI